jgi:hypothetical protein
MFDNFLVRPGSLANDVSDGQITGFRMAVRQANYRGCYVSLHNGYFLQVDGVAYERDLQTFEVNGRPPRSFETIRGAVWEHWNFDDEGILHVALLGGLEPGVHEIDLQQSVLAAYGYHPTDEEWVRNPPKPGQGAGSDKTPVVVTYRLELNMGASS